MEQAKFSVQEPSIDLKKVYCSRDTEEIFRTIWEDISFVESVYLILLNKANKPIAYKRISSGGVDGCIVDCKVIFHFAVQYLASNIIIAHNHPSGNLTPSREDKAVTQKVKEGAKLLDIVLLDHLILAPNNGEYYSFTDEGLI